ncbi:MAG TPA: hypothetical protein VIH87_11010 [Methylocella sp.]
MKPAPRAEDMGVHPAAPPMTTPCGVPAMDIAVPEAPPCGGGDGNSR